MIVITISYRFFHLYHNCIINFSPYRQIYSSKEKDNKVPLKIQETKNFSKRTFLSNYCPYLFKSSSPQCITRTMDVWRPDPIIPTRGQIKVNQSAGSELQQPGRKWSLLIGPITNDKFRCGRSFVSTIGHSSVFNPIMPTGGLRQYPRWRRTRLHMPLFPFPLLASALTSAYECFRLPRLRVQTPSSPCRPLHSHLHRILLHTRCPQILIHPQISFSPFPLIFTTGGKERSFLVSLK